MSMTFLQLSSRVRQEVGGAGTGPTAVTSQTGESRRIVDWVATSDEDIQRLHNQWKFLVGSFTVNTVADDGSYTYTDCSITYFREWRKDSFKIYLSSGGVGGERDLIYIDYQAWYEIYNTNSQTSGHPIHFTIAPDQSIKLGPVPDAVYVLSGEYWKAVTPMTANDDVPLYPSEYHMACVYRTMMKYARYTGAAEIYQDAEKEYTRLIAEMEITQLPEMLMAGPLA